MKILLTGSSGFLGKKYIDRYTHEHQFSTFSLLQDDITTIDFKEIDTVLHCAALVHQTSKLSYEKYYEINTGYPVELAKQAKQYGVKQFVFISTVSVYGEGLEIVSENTLCNPISFYGRSKLEAEQQLLKLNDKSFKVAIIRPPMVYGKDAPGNIDSLVKLVKKMPFLPLGSINNKRSFVYVDNLTYLIDNVIRQCQSGVFLASDDRPLSTTELIKLIAGSLNKKVYLFKFPFFEILLKLFMPSFHKRLYRSLEIDNTLTKAKLELKNPFSVEEGIQFMIYGVN